MNLFLDQAPDFKKEAAFAARLSEQPENWPQEINSEIFKQLPFLSDYQVDVHIDRQDPERGAAFGYADVSNKTERPETEHQETGMPHVRIPVIVMDRSMKPFSVFLDGERVLPLSEERIREFLFNPSTFDLSTSTPRDPSLVEPLMPPQRSGMGMGGEYKMASVDLSKMSAEERFVYEGMLEKQAKHGFLGDLKVYARGLKNIATGSQLREGLSEAKHYRGVQKSFEQGVPGYLAPSGRKAIQAAKDLKIEGLKHALKGAAKTTALYGTAAGAAVGAKKLHDRSKEPVEKTSGWKGTAAAMGATGLAAGAYGHHEGKKKGTEVGFHIGQESPKGSKIEYVGRNHPTRKAFPKARWDVIHPGGMDKESFKHMSKEQWTALYENPNVMKAIEKAGGDKNTRDVQNALYEAAAKVYGFHPKVASVQNSSLLLDIASTLREEDVQGFIEKLSSDKVSQAGFQRSGVQPLLVEVFDNTKRASADERLLALTESIEPSVVTVQKLPGGDFLVKSAAGEAFAPGPAADGQIVPAEEAAGALGPDTAQQMQPGQSATAVANPAVTEDPDAMPSRAKVVEEFGQYKVQDHMGNTLLGHVFPHTIAWDGNFSPQPMALFTNGSAYAFQDNVAGELVGKGTNMPDDSPRGDGVFYYVKNGEGFATGPITIGSTMAGPDGLPKFIGTDTFGQQLQVSKMEGLKKPMRVADNEYALPEDWKFMRLNNQTQLIPDPLQMNKSAAVRDEQSGITLFFNGSYNFTGGCGIDKVASQYRDDLDPIGAEFMLGLLGVEGGLAKVKVAECRKRGMVKMSGLRTIRLLSERYQEAEKTAAALMLQIPDLRVDLLKEAAQIGDPDTIDKLLALNFINPENLTTFINYLPELEACGEKLAEMLLYSYMGLKEVPEEPVDRAMKNLEEVIKSLKAVGSAEA